MKRLTLILTLVLILASFVGCIKEPSEPTDDLIRENLQSQLNEYQIQSGNYPLDIVACEVIKSLTEEKTYSAQFNVATQSNYANLYFTADVVYTLYDQGWSIDSCQWEMLNYEVVKYPSEEDIQYLPNGDLVSTLDELELSNENDLFMVSGIYKIDWSPYTIGMGDMTITWQYDVSNDEWLHSNTTQGDTHFTLTSDFKAAWADCASHDKLESGIEISNITETGFDILTDNVLFKAGFYHVELENAILASDQEEITLKFKVIDTQFYIKKYQCTQNSRLQVNIVILKAPEKIENQFYNYVYDMRVDYTIINDGPYGYDIYASSLPHTVNS